MVSLLLLTSWQAARRRRARRPPARQPQEKRLAERVPPATPSALLRHLALAL